MSAAFFAEKARRCRELAALAQDVDLRDQLLTFAREFEERAEEFATSIGKPGGPRRSWAH